MPYKKIPRKCDHCGNEYLALPQSLRKGMGRFCSHICHGATRKTGEDRQCVECGRAFYRKVYKLARPDKPEGTFCSKACQMTRMAREQVGEGHPKWKGGKVNRNGYTYVYQGEYRNGQTYYRAEHRLAAESAAGRPLMTGEQVHHKNGVKTDNRIENLDIMTAAEHAKLHHQWRHTDQLGRYQPEGGSYGQG